MAKKKGNPEKVNPVLAREAWQRAKGERTKAYSEYIRLHYQATGSLAPGCDNRDLQAWIDDNL